MTFLYDAQYSVVLLRPKNEVKLLTQSALDQVCMRKWPVPSLAELFLGLQKSPRRSDFFQEVRLLPMQSLKKMSTNGRGGGGKKFEN